MTDVATSVITSFISAFTLFLAVAAFTSRQTKDVKADISGLRTELKGDISGLRTDVSELRTELKGDISRLDERFDRMMFELVRSLREGGQPPPQAA